MEKRGEQQPDRDPLVLVEELRTINSGIKESLDRVQGKLDGVVEGLEEAKDGLDVLQQRLSRRRENPIIKFMKSI